MSILRCLASAVLVASTLVSPALAQSLQRVYVPPQSVKFGYFGGIIRGQCLDRNVVGAPKVADTIDKFGAPENIVIHKIDRDNRVVATQLWADVLAKKEEPWVEFRGASDISGGVNLQVKPVKYEPSFHYEVNFKKGMPAARPQETITAELLKDIERHNSPIERMTRLDDEFHIFEPRSPLRAFSGEYAKDVYWRVSEGVTPEQSEARIGKFVDGVLNLARGESPEYVRLAATYLGGKIDEGSARAKFFEAHGLDVRAKVSPALEQAVLNLRESMFLEESAAGYAFSRGAEAIPASMTRDVRDSIKLMLRWEREKIPVGSGRQMLEALAIERGPRLGFEAGRGTLTDGGEKLEITKIQHAIDDGAAVLHEDAKLLALDEELKKTIKPLLELKDSGGRSFKAALEIADVSVSLRELRAGKFQGGRSDAVAQLSFKLLRTARGLKEAGMDLPPKLAEVVPGLDRVPSAWLDRLVGHRLVDVSKGITDEQIRELSRDLANLEATTGVIFTLAFNESSNFRAAATRNGETVAISADASMKKTDVPAITTSLFEHLTSLAARLKAEDGDVRILVAHNEGQSSYETWMKMVQNDEFAHKQWIVGPCPFKDATQQYDLMRSAVDPKIGKAVSAVASTEMVDLTCFTMAVDSIVQIPADRRRGVEPIRLLREGYDRSWRRLEVCLKAQDKAERDTAIVKEFGEKLAPGIIEKLDQPNGVENFEGRIRSESRIFNSIAVVSSPRDRIAT